MIIKDYAEDNDIIGDFFSGSGTVCVCAKESGHKFVGVEINEEFYVKSINRLKGMTENGQTSIFTDFEELK